MINSLVKIVVSLILISCSNQKKIAIKSISDNDPKKNPNILLILADDLGSDAFSSYDIGTSKPKMPTIEKLTKNGLRFTNFWAYPACTPTRSSIITGKHSFVIHVRQVGDELDTKEIILQKFIDQKTQGNYASAVIGKWHLSKNKNHPNEIGVQHYSGLLSGRVRDYNTWMHTENGIMKREQTYITSKFTDLAIDWVQKQQKPWFLWLAYNAPHTPFHLPPDQLHSSHALTGTENDIKNNPQPYFFSMIEAMDTEIGRLLNSIPKNDLDNTVIIFVGDNGSPNQVAQTYGRRKAKGSMYQGGINVPLIVSGKNMQRVNQIENALVHSTDLFATIAELAGTGIRTIHNSKSIIPLLKTKNLTHRDYVYSELKNKRKSGYTIRNKRYKYITYDNGKEEFYDLQQDPLETKNLILNTAYQNTKQELIDAVIELRNK